MTSSQAGDLSSGANSSSYPKMISLLPRTAGKDTVFHTPRASLETAVKTNPAGILAIASFRNVKLAGNGSKCCVYRHTEKLIKNWPSECSLLMIVTNNFILMSLQCSSCSLLLYQQEVRAVLSPEYTHLLVHVHGFLTAGKSSAFLGWKKNETS